MAKSIHRNTASQTLKVFAFDSSTNAPKTGDAANITAVINQDGGTDAATNDVNPTEVNASTRPGEYEFTLTQAETNANDFIDVRAVSATANVVVLTEGGSEIDVVDPGFYDTAPLTAAETNAEVDTALTDIGLDHLLAASVAGTDVTDNSIIAKLVSASATADWDSYANTTDALESIATRALLALPNAGPGATGGLSLYDDVFAGAIVGTVSDAGPAAGNFDLDANFATATTNAYRGAWLMFLSGSALFPQCRKITSSDTTPNVVFSGTANQDADAPFTAAPTNGDPCMIFGFHGA